MSDPCRVCGEPTTEHSNAVCSRCGDAFHLALRQDIPAKDCGQVWIDEHLLALQFACDTCLALEQQAGEAEPAATPFPAGAAAAPAPGPLAPTGASASAAKRRYVRREGASAATVARLRRRQS